MVQTKVEYIVNGLSHYEGGLRVTALPRAVFTDIQWTTVYWPQPVHWRASWPYYHRTGLGNKFTPCRKTEKPLLAKRNRNVKGGKGLR